MMVVLSDGSALTDWSQICSLKSCYARVERHGRSVEGAILNRDHLVLAADVSSPERICAVV